MDIQDILFGSDVALELKQAVLELCHEHSISAFTAVVTPTAANNDVDGSQHGYAGGTDFTYRDATEEDLVGPSELGYYEYFSAYGEVYTGHYYEGDGHHFEALVIDPPTYAAEKTI